MLWNFRFCCRVSWLLLVVCQRKKYQQYWTTDDDHAFVGIQSNYHRSPTLFHRIPKRQDYPSFNSSQKFIHFLLAGSIHFFHSFWGVKNTQGSQSGTSLWLEVYNLKSSPFEVFLVCESLITLVTITLLRSEDSKCQGTLTCQIPKATNWEIVFLRDLCKKAVWACFKQIKS